MVGLLGANDRYRMIHDGHQRVECVTNAARRTTTASMLIVGLVFVGYDQSDARFAGWKTVVL